MLTSTIEYIGGLRTKCTHLQSGSEINTDAPTDNMGRGEKFSPTDLLATSLAACILTTIAIFGEKENRKWDFTGAKAFCQKVMYSDPRRVGEIHIQIDFASNNYSPEEQKLIERVAHTCPVARSLHPDLKVVLVLNF